MMLNRRQWVVLCGAATLGHPVLALSVDHSHAAWSRLLQQHVVVQRGGQASQVRYTGFLAQRSEVQSYLRQLSAVSRSGFDAFSRTQQMAFLINAYNAFTVELILTRYPRLKSIKDLGNFLPSPWKQRWITLLGETVSLDDIEHGMLRKRGVYDDPSIHFAVNCASIGCPMLREEAYVPGRLEAQLDVFSLHGLASRFAHVLADRARIRSSQVLITYLDYDWRLNDAKVTP